MVADAPYSSNELVMSPWLGLLLGAGAGLAIMPTWAPLFAFAGWLYALCQQRCSLVGLVLVGLSYGIMFWIACRLGNKIHLVPRWELTQCLGFTEGLALVSIVLSLTSKTANVALPKD